MATTKRSNKIIAAVAFALIVCTLLCMNVFAKLYGPIYVYGDRYTVVASGTADNTGSYLSVTVNNIYKADGSNSNYSTVKADVLNSSGSQISSNTNVALSLGTATNISLIQSYNSGTSMRLRMKGNMSSLDCQVKFTAALS